MKEPSKILQIGNYPPPMCGWAIQTKLVTEELRHRGHICEVLKINVGREIPSNEYINVTGGFDYAWKVVRYALRGYRLNVHVNGMSTKGYQLAFVAAIAGRIVNRPALITFHGGLSQLYFPCRKNSFWWWAFFVLFGMAGAIACDSEPIKEAIAAYGIRPGKIESIATFSPQYANFDASKLPENVEQFLAAHPKVIASYVTFRPEYGLESLREGMNLYRKTYPDAGFIWLGFPEKELIAAEEFLQSRASDERNNLLLLGNLPHDQFLTLLSRTFICLRTPACDGVAASVLEAIALKVPVVASENGRRPAGVVTYEDLNPQDMAAKLAYVAEHYREVKSGLSLESGDDNILKMADWITGGFDSRSRLDAVPVR